VLNCILIGDLHLDGMQADLGAKANSLQMREVAKAEAWAVANGIPEVVYLGDLCNRHVLTYDGHLLLHAQWSKYPHLIRRVILGNHDFAEDGVHSLRLLSTLRPLPNVHVYDKPTTEDIGGVTVNFLPYPYPDVDWGGELDGCINVSHFEVKGARQDNGAQSRSTKGVPKGTVWMMGHLHTPHDVGSVHYVGTLYQKTFGESLPKSFTWLKAKAGDKLKTKVERVPVDPAFKLITLDIEEEDDLKQIDSNPLTKYKLVVSQAVGLSDQFLSSHPNVVRHNSYRTKDERAMLLESFDVTQVVDQGNPYQVSEYLKVKHAYLSDKHFARADEIVREIKSRIEKANG